MTENKSIKQKKKMPAITVAFILVALFPTVSHLLIFWLPVQGSSLLLAFEDQRTGSFTLWGNFSQAIQMCLNGEEALGEGLKNTSIFFLVGLLLSLMSFFAAYMLYKKMFGSAVTFELKSDETLVQTLVYSAKTYAYAMAQSENESMRDLAVAAWNYGTAAAQYVQSQEV